MYVPYPCRIRSYDFMEQMPSYMRHTLVGAEFIPRAFLPNLASISGGGTTGKYDRNAGIQDTPAAVRGMNSAPTGWEWRIYDGICSIKS